MPAAILDLGTENLIDNQVRVDEELLARRSAAVGRDHIGIKGLKQGDSAGIVAGEGPPGLGGHPRLPAPHGARTHLGHEALEQPSAQPPRQASGTREPGWTITEAGANTE